MEDTETGALLADGFEEALIGLGTQFNKEVAVYDYEKCIAILMRAGMDHEEASKYMDFNVTGAYVGEHTPVFVRRECLPVT